MTDTRLRAAERTTAADPHNQDAQIVLAKARLRADVLMPIPSGWLGKAGMCKRCKGGKVVVPTNYTSLPVCYEECPDCKGTGLICHRSPTQPDAPVRDIMRLKAYVGDSVARAVVQENRIYVEALGWIVGDASDPWWTAPDAWGPEDWALWFLSLATSLPAIEVHGVVCGCVRLTSGGNTDMACDTCNRKGIRTFKVPPERYMAVRMAVAVAKEVLRKESRCSQLGQYEHRASMCSECFQTTRRLGPSIDAVFAADAWLACPCPERVEACLATQHVEHYWVDGTIVLAAGNGVEIKLHLADTLASAAKIIELKDIRTAAQKALL